jgi:hypothetical protein
MKHLILTFAAAISLAAPLPADSQNAVPRGGGGGGGSSSGGSSGGSSSGGGSTTSSSGGDSGGSSWSPPRHPGGSSSARGGGRSGGGSNNGGSASPRRSPGGTSSDSGRGPDRVVGSSTDGPSRGGRPITGYAVPRGTVVPSGRPGGDYYFYPRSRDWYHSPWYYSRYSPYYYSGFGASMWGLGYIWDPFWFGPGYGYGYDPFYGGGYAYGGGGGGYANDDDDDEYTGEGGLRIKVKPREARVMVDGSFAGVVDDFDGNFQKLRLDEGAHKIVLQAEGFEPLAFDVLIVEGQTVTYKGQMRGK